MTALALLGLGNMLTFPLLIGTSLTGVAPEKAGVASGTLATAQQFAGTTGLAAIGTLFFTTLGSRTDATGYAVATERVVWVELGAVGVLAVLVWLVTRPGRRPGN